MQKSELRLSPPLPRYEGTGHCCVRPRTNTPGAQAHDRATQELKALQVKHSTALELLGERNERVDELEQDLAEARTIYRSQILMLCPQLA